jgi:flagellar hook protein FlgE
MGFNIGLSGLNAASKNLDVIGHNIANSSTIGMKAGRAEFSELIASSLGAAGGSTGGIGVSVATVSQQFTQGNIKSTGNVTDLAINGAGFFKVTQTDGSTAYTRDGEFKLDKDGYIVTNTGAQLQGFQTDRSGNRTSVVTSSLVLPTGSVIAPKATGTDPTNPGITLTANLDSRVTTQLPDPPVDPLPDSQKTYGTALNVYDTLGNAVPLEVYFIKSGTANQWAAKASTDGGVTTMDMGTITFDPTTGLPASNTLTGLTIPAATAPAVVPSADIVIPPINVGNATDGWTLTQYGTSFSVYDLKQDGYAPGNLTSISIGENGMLQAQYSNGTTQDAGQVALTSFRNVQGLAPSNGGYWSATFASGDPVDMAPQEGNMGSIRSGSLEESNVDLTAELVNMIVAQRAYQANAQTIKTQDQVQSTLVNLR